MSDESGTPSNTEDQKNTENPGGSGESQAADEQELDDSWLAKQDEKTQSYIKRLRKESGQYRKENKTLKNNMESLSERFGRVEGGLKQMLGLEEGQEIDPNEHLAALQAQNEQVVVRSAILESALENGIAGREQLDYYEHLVMKKSAALEEGEEFTEEDFNEIISQVKKVFGNQMTKTSVTAQKPNPDEKAEVSLDQFAKMGVIEKSALYQKNPALYSQLMSEARQTRRL
jgi:hypothetical protein